MRAYNLDLLNIEQRRVWQRLPAQGSMLLAQNPGSPAASPQESRVPPSHLTKSQKVLRAVWLRCSEMTRWMAGKAEELGVDLYPGFAASEVLYSRQGQVAGVATGDVGIAKDGSRRDSFARGTELRAKLTLLGEGCRGSLSEVSLSENLRCLGEDTKKS